MPPVTRSIPSLVRLTVLAVMLALGTGLLGGLHRAMDHGLHRHASPLEMDPAPLCGVTPHGPTDLHAASPAPLHNGSQERDPDPNHCDTCHLLASWAADRLGLDPAALPQDPSPFAPLLGAPQVGGALHVDASWSLRGPPRLA